ncbi:MAG TPA: phosphatase PAP2 family protein, partial [Candidatus Elarobacter sp.]|nr:phosphatase PAP2 family protein [Candidatus Elarobacter sp.]
HAMFALLVYGLWAWFVWNSGLPRAVRFTLAPLLALWACGVLWSRLALGAHYITDLAGGLLLATAALGFAALVAVAIRAARGQGGRAVPG